MNRQLTLFSLLFIACLHTRAQENNPLINSGETIQNGIKLYEEGKYKEALKEFQLVKTGDTNYVWALYEKALACTADSQYVLGLRYCEEAMSLKADRERSPELLDQYASLLDYANQRDRSLRISDSAIALYPAYVTLYVNKGTTLLRMKKYKEAEKVFQQALLINPYSASAHFKMGLAAIDQGHIVPAYLSLVACLIIEPDGRFAKNSISLLNSMAKSKDDVMELVNNRQEESPENFRLIEQIVLSKIALDKKYASLIDLDDPISRQMQVIFEKLSYDENDNDFYMQYYVPFFRNMFENKKFEYLVNYAFSGVDIQSIKDFNRKKKKDIDAFVSDVVEYFNLIRVTRELKVSKRSYNGLRYYYQGGILIGKGIARDNGNVLTGQWEYYYPAGNKKAAGLYNDKGGKEGPWVYYYFSGQVKGQEIYRNDKQEGPETYYFNQGIVSSRASYKNGQADGEYTSYYRNGATKLIEYFNDGKLNGAKKIFYESGVQKSLETFVNDIQEGTFKTFHTNGQLESEGKYAGGKLSGPYKAWYNDGVLSVEAQYDQDIPVGVIKRYHENGKLKSVETYSKGILEGEYISYHDNGQVNMQYVNKKGKLSGDVNYYDRDGKLYSTLTFDADYVKAGKYFDKTGKQISISETKRGKLDLTVYNPDGTKRTFTPYNEKGEINGTQIFYHGSGKEKETDEYTNGKLKGEVVAYHSSGQKSSVGKYVDGKKDGYYISWFSHGVKQEEGWYKDDNLQGEWLRYNELGTLISRTNFLNDELNGMKTNYWPNGKKESEYVYEMGTLVELTDYDSTNKMLNHVKLNNGSGKFLSLNVNGKPYGEGNYVQGSVDGPFKYYFFDGSLQSVQYYKKGLLDSIYRSYNFGGKLSSEGTYKMNEKTDTWKFYRQDGTLWYTEEYKADELHGKRIYYFKSGKIDTELTFENGERNGPYKRFSEEGTLMFQLRYEESVIMGFSYLGKNGELVPEIPFLQGNGMLKAFYPNGNESISVQYVDGLQHGPYKLYHPNGKMNLENTEVYGSSEGPMKEYYPDGTLRSIYNFQHDNVHGPYKEYNAKGIVIEEGTYYNGAYNGELRYYDDNGKVKQVRVYYYGQLLSVK